MKRIMVLLKRAAHPIQFFWKFSRAPPPETKCPLDLQLFRVTCFFILTVQSEFKTKVKQNTIPGRGFTLLFCSFALKSRNILHWALVFFSGNCRRCLLFRQKIRKFWLKVKWNSNFPEKRRMLFADLARRLFLKLHYVRTPDEYIGY